MRDLRDQAVAASVPFFHKQWGQFRPDGAVYEEGETEADFDEQLLELYGSGCALEPDGTRPIRWDSRGVTVSAVPSTSAWWMSKVGKKEAGRQLDGRVWNEQPARHLPGIVRACYTT